MAIRRNVFLGICAAVAILVATACSPSYPECNEDADCAEKGEVCLNAKCAECRSDEHCTTKFDERYYCQQGSCLQITGYCNPENGFNCGEFQKCRDFRCGPQCYPESVAEDCKPGEICENNRCIPKPECLTDDDCTDGKICKSRKCVEPPVCQMRLAYFDFDESAIRYDAKEAIEANATCMKSREDVKGVQVVGHCDQRGTEAYNMALGTRRANAVKKMLRKLGISKISTKSRGALDPAVPNATTEAEYQKNRRAVFNLN